MAAPGRHAGGSPAAHTPGPRSRPATNRFAETEKVRFGADAPDAGPQVVLRGGRVCARRAPPLFYHMTHIIDGLTTRDYQFEGRTVRTSITTDGNPLFVAKDVCEVLAISDYKQVIDRVPDYGKGGGIKHPTLGGSQEMATLTEAGVYWVALRSKKPEAEAFQKWVCTEVLPSIRKTGQYRLANPSTLNQIERCRLRMRAAELRGPRAQALEACARGPRYVSSLPPLADRPAGYLQTTLRLDGEEGN